MGGVITSLRASIPELSLAIAGFGVFVNVNGSLNEKDNQITIYKVKETALKETTRIWKAKNEEYQRSVSWYARPFYPPPEAVIIIPSNETDKSPPKMKQREMENCHKAVIDSLRKMIEEMR